MREIKQVVLHSSASRWGSATVIRNWHLAKGWADIGYHVIIGNGYPNSRSAPDAFVAEALGAVWRGRDLDGDGDVFEHVGAQAYGINETSIGVCLIGDGDFKEAQLIAAHGAVARICKMFDLGPEAVLGHRETPYEQKRAPEKRKKCPQTDCHAFRLGVRRALQVLEAADIVESMGRTIH